MAKPASLLSQSDYETLAAFRHSLRKFLAVADGNARAAGLAPQQHQALLAIMGGYPGRTSITIGELAYSLQLKHHSAVELVGRLVKADLVSRAPSLEDRREVLITATPAGEAILHSLSAVNMEELRSAAPVLRELLVTLERRSSEGER